MVWGRASGHPWRDRGDWGNRPVGVDVPAMAKGEAADVEGGIEAHSLDFDECVISSQGSSTWACLRQASFESTGLWRWAKSVFRREGRSARHERRQAAAHPRSKPRRWECL